MWNNTYMGLTGGKKYKMKKILIRTRMSPTINYNPKDVIYNNMIGSNIGNMLFPYSVSRTLMKEDVLIRPFNTSKSYSDAEINRINETYDCLVLPFANAFRISFIEDLKKVTEVVKRLRIPCIVVGVGAQAAIGKELQHKEVAKAVKEFMAAILEKSDIVGLRGEFTADYLTKLGFQAEKDFTVIGCPSMYLYGKELPKMEIKELTPQSNVSTNSKISLTQNFHDFMHRSREAIPNYHYVVQVIEEIRKMYVNCPFPNKYDKWIPKHFPVDYDDELYCRGKGISFVNVPSWLEYLEKKDFSFGSRIHGNIAAILAGTPCYIVVSDSRIKELVDYHNIPHMMEADLTSETNIFDLHNKADFSRIMQGHDKRFMHYLDFLNRNGLETIYNENGEAGSSAFDNIIQNTSFAPPLTALASLSPKEQSKRIRSMKPAARIMGKIKNSYEWNHV